MSTSESRTAVLDHKTLSSYRRTLDILGQSGIPFLVGGAYAFERYTGITRHTKDFDVFVRADALHPVLETLEAAGYRIDVPFPHWLGKAFDDEILVDVIFGAGNGIACVDDTWFEYAIGEQVFGAPVRLIPAEEMIWSKAFIMERERYDGADVVHLLRARAHELDWARLVARFGDNWRVLLAHLVIFGFVYPDQRDAIPSVVLDALTSRLSSDDFPTHVDAQAVCRGPLISREQYLHDIATLGYRDARLAPHGAMTEDQIEVWTEAIGKEERNR